MQRVLSKKAEGVLMACSPLDFCECVSANYLDVCNWLPVLFVILAAVVVFVFLLLEGPLVAREY